MAVSIEGTEGRGAEGETYGRSGFEVESSRAVIAAGRLFVGATGASVSISIVAWRGLQFPLRRSSIGFCSFMVVGDSFGAPAFFFKPTNERNCSAPSTSRLRNSKRLLSTYLQQPFSRPKSQ